MPMHKRIAKFAQKAGINVKELEKPYSGGFPREDIIIVEDFGKLIAEDCANICLEYAMPDGTSETAIILADTIRKKYGIKND